jgi:hypothetical protein
MSSNVNLVRFLFYLPVALELVIAWLLLKRRLHREVTWFFIYIVFQIVGTCLLYPLYEARNVIGYFFGMWVFEGISVTMAFMVILETFRLSVAQYKSVRRIGTRLLVLAALLSIVVALVLTPYGAQASTAMMKFILVTERSLRIIQLVILVTMFAFSSYLALSWKHYVFGIALGYGLYAAANLACYTYLAYVGVAANAKGSTIGANVSLLDSASFSCAVAIWLIYLLQREPKGPGLPPTANQDLQEWSEALSDLDKAAR